MFLWTEHKRLDIYSDAGVKTSSVDLSEYDDTELKNLVTTVENMQEQLDTVAIEADAALTLATVNENDIVTMDTQVKANKSLSEANASNLEALSDTVQGNTTQITANTKAIETNISAIDSKADSSEITTINETLATKADKSAVSSIQSDLSSLSVEVEANTTLSGENATEINSLGVEVATTKGLADKAVSDVAALNVTVGENTAQVSKNTKNISDNTADIASNASAITGLTTAVDNNSSALADKADKSTVTDLTSKVTKNTTDIASNKALIDSLAEGSGDESDYVMVHDFSGLKFDNKTLDTYLTQYDNETQCHQMLNAIRRARPVKGGATKWIMYVFHEK